MNDLFDNLRSLEAIDFNFVRRELWKTGFSWDKINCLLKSGCTFSSSQEFSVLCHAADFCKVLTFLCLELLLSCVFVNVYTLTICFFELIEQIKKCTYSWESGTFILLNSYDALLVVYVAHHTKVIIWNHSITWLTLVTLFKPISRCFSIILAINYVCFTNMIIINALFCSLKEMLKSSCILIWISVWS